MSLSQGQNSALSSHLEALVAKHTALSQSIDQEMKHPAVNETALRKLKRQKLKLKEEIEILRQAS